MIKLIMQKEGYDKIEVTTTFDRIEEWQKAGYTIISERVIYN